VATGAVVLNRLNASRVMRILAVLTVLNAPTSGKPLVTVVSLVILGPIAFFLWRAATFRDRMGGEIGEANAEYVAGYLTNLRWYFMIQVILIILALVAVAGFIVYAFLTGG